MRHPAKFNGGIEKLQQQLNKQPHFLDSCFLCQKQLAQNSDIFMYRGDTPFCSQECRQEQIEIDDAKEKRWKKGVSSSTSTSSSSSSKRASRNSAESRKESNTNKTVRTEAVVVV